MMCNYGDMTTQNDVVFDDMIMEKYHLKDQELFLNELYLARSDLKSKQAMTIWSAILNQYTIYIWHEDPTWVTTI